MSPNGADGNGEASSSPAALVRAVPGLTRIAAVAWLRTAEWGVGASWRASSRILRAAVSGESPAELFQDAGSELRAYARRLLELAGSENGAVSGADENSVVRAPTPPPRDEANEKPSTLRERGAELLRRSEEVGIEEEAHPAFARILDQLAPDEGRVLRLLALQGPQPSVDVRTSKLLDPSSELIAAGLNMIDSSAGCRHPERLTMYLDNLNRLGLIAFSKEPLEDVNRYQLLESQAHVGEAMERAGRGRTVRRSIRLTPFGGDFCDTCLPLTTAELDELPSSGDSERTDESLASGAAGSRTNPSS